MEIFAHVGVELYVTVKVQKTKLFLTMPQPRADLLWERRSEKMPDKCPGGWACSVIVFILDDTLFFQTDNVTGRIVHPLD